MDEDAFNLLGISSEDWAQTPPSVQLAVSSVLTIVTAQSAQIKELQTRVRDLEAKLGQTSRTSSRPPSSDPPSLPPSPPPVPSPRRAGGQPGHVGHQRPLLPPDQVDEVVLLHPAQCEACHAPLPGDVPLSDHPRRTQVYELPRMRPYVTEYCQVTVACPRCHHHTTAALPPHVPPGAFGPRATALMALLRGRYRLSLDDTAEFLADVYGLPVSAASVVTSCARTSVALGPVDAAIQAVVQAAPQVNADETSWPTETRTGWLWVATCACATCFRVHPSRGGAALRQLLGPRYAGIVGSDRWTAYAQVPDGRRQLCWAHLVRNVRGLDDRYGADTGWAQQVLALADALFLTWHLYTGGWFDHIAMQQALIPVRWAIRACLEEGAGSAYPKIATFSRDLLAHWDALWTFSRVAGVEPTNNAAERALRHAVLWRKGSFGSRSAVGCRFVERVLSVRATCRQQARSLFAFVTDTLQAVWAGAPAPLLVLLPAQR